MNPIPFLITAAVSYLWDRFPSAICWCASVTGEDVRASGSGNIGATNVARKSPALGIATLVLDAAKGMAAVYFAGWLSAESHRHLLMSTAAFFAVCGHLFPVWLKFHGGKGVATSLGAFVFLTPKSILCMVVLFMVLAVAFRYVSLGSIAVAAAFPLLAWALDEYREPLELLIIAIVSGLVIWKHRQNINRLASGTESRIGQKLDANRRPIQEGANEPHGSHRGGAWGTALAIALGRKGGHTIRLWANEPEVVESIATRRVNERFLPGFEMPSSIEPTHDLKSALEGAEIVVSVMPSQHCRALFERMAPDSARRPCWSVAPRDWRTERCFG